MQETPPPPNPPRQIISTQNSALKSLRVQVHRNKLQTASLFVTWRHERCVTWPHPGTSKRCLRRVNGYAARPTDPIHRTLARKECSLFNHRLSPIYWTFARRTEEEQNRFSSPFSRDCKLFEASRRNTVFFKIFYFLPVCFQLIR